MEAKQPELVRLTQSAAEHVRTMRTEQPDSADKHLRVYVEDGGCSGMQYGLVFDEKRPDDIVSEFYGVPLLVDRFSADYLHGAVVDYVDSLNSGGFKISHPQARHTCGCGPSLEA